MTPLTKIATMVGVAVLALNISACGTLSSNASGSPLNNKPKMRRHIAHSRSSKHAGLRTVAIPLRPATDFPVLTADVFQKLGPLIQIPLVGPRHLPSGAVFATVRTFHKGTGYAVMWYSRLAAAAFPNGPVSTQISRVEQTAPMASQLGGFSYAIYPSMTQANAQVTRYFSMPVKQGTRIPLTDGITGWLIHTAVSSAQIDWSQEGWTGWAINMVSTSSSTASQIANSTIKAFGALSTIPHAVGLRAISESLLPPMNPTTMIWVGPGHAVVDLYAGGPLSPVDHQAISLAQLSPTP